ncbi:DUF6884 domain-containing protein [Paenibacillus sp. FSL L8-0436]|uniref:DUF7662 domain-containing protein n=1 Tax=Paenibacillus sp. FSL L8-0436 TaxID=2954686 RepID=UPI0031599020
MNRDKSLCIIPCGAAKIWDKQPNQGATEAQYVYTGVFAVTCQKYARTYFDNWVILSAKHGFLFPSDLIPEDYNVSFVKPSIDTILLDQLHEQAKSKGLLAYEEVTVLGGKHYAERVKAIFNQGQQLIFPLSDCKGIGYMLQKITHALEENRELTSIVASEIPKKEDKAKSKNNSITRENNLNESSIGKYHSLHDFLVNHLDGKVVLSIEQIEAILGFSSPGSSLNHRPWWANSLSQSHAKSWLMAGWEVDKVALGKVVTFRRML